MKNKVFKTIKLTGLYTKADHYVLGKGGVIKIEFLEGQSYAIYYEDNSLLFVHDAKNSYGTYLNQETELK